MIFLRTVTIYNILFFCHIKQIHSMLLWVYLVIDHRKCQNVKRKSVTHVAAPCVQLFCSYQMSSVNFSEEMYQANGICLLSGVKCDRVMRFFS